MYPLRHKNFLLSRAMCLATATYNIYWAITSPYHKCACANPELDVVVVWVNAFCATVCAVLARRIDSGRSIKKRLYMDIAVWLFLFCILCMRVISNVIDDNISHPLAVLSAFLVVLFVWYPQVSVLAMLTYECWALLSDIEHLTTAFEAGKQRRGNVIQRLTHRLNVGELQSQQGVHSSGFERAHKKQLYVALSRHTLLINSVYYYAFPIALIAVVMTLGIYLLTLFTKQWSFVHVGSAVVFLNLLLLAVPALSVALVNHRIVTIKSTVSTAIATTCSEQEERELAILLLLMTHNPPVLRIFGVELDFTRCVGSIALRACIRSQGRLQPSAAVLASSTSPPLNAAQKRTHCLGSPLVGPSAPQRSGKLRLEQG
jgi:hypothetical protein